MSHFLTAEWRRLLMLNYAVEPALLRPFLPKGVELDSWNGRHYLSMVGFLFLNTRVLGVCLPFHSNFEEVNLRFYVRRHAPEGWRRGVVFIKEIVPRRLIASVARVCYNEPYAAMPMRHSQVRENGSLRPGDLAEYSWRHENRWNFMRATLVGSPLPLVAGSEEAFITEHYWGYTAQPNGGCKEFQVTHAPWNVWQVKDPALDCHTAPLYGAKFVDPLRATPLSTFVAEGSRIKVGTGAWLTPRV